MPSEPTNAETPRAYAGRAAAAAATNDCKARAARWSIVARIAGTMAVASLLVAAGFAISALRGGLASVIAAALALGLIAWLALRQIASAPASPAGDREELEAQRALKRTFDWSETALRAARLSEARFRDIAAVAIEIFWESDAQHRFTLVIGDAGQVIRQGDLNRRALGKTRWELAGANAETDPLWRQHKADMDAHRPIRQFRYRRMAPDGKAVHFSVSGNPIFDEDGRFLGYRGTASVETEIVDAQERAERADALLRDAVASIPAGFVIYDADDRLYLCNQAYRGLYPANAELMTPGARFEDILRAGLERGQHPEAKGHEEEWLAERLAQHGQLREEHEQQLADGRWVLITERRMSTGGTAGLRIDITALKKIQASLRESQAQLNEAQRVSNTGSAVRDFRANKTIWSDQLFRIFGLRRDGDAPRFDTFLDLVHPEDRERVKGIVMAALSGEASPAIQYRIIRPDGAIRWVYREAKVTVDRDGAPVLLTSTFKDITEQCVAEQRQAELESQLRHSQRLEALGTLAGGIAHDLNNTLVPILALSKLALRLLPPDSPVRDDLATVVAASEQARDLVRQILAFSRKQELDKHEIDLRAVTRESLSMLRASLPATVRLIDDLAEVPPVLGDAGQLQQVMVNLVANAAHAIGTEIGTITVTLAPVEAEADDTGARVRLSVSDTGCGIDQAHLERIFEPFFTTKPVSEGTGLGLAVVHGIVTGHDGSIEVNARPGQGSEFRIILPTIRGHDVAADVDRSAA